MIPIRLAVRNFMPYRDNVPPLETGLVGGRVLLNTRDNDTVRVIEVLRLGEIVRDLLGHDAQEASDDLALADQRLGDVLGEVYGNREADAVRRRVDRRVDTYDRAVYVD